MKFINDAQRISAINLINRRIALKRSILIQGKFGVGKTELLKQLHLKHPNAKRLSAIGSITQLLGEMAGFSEPKSWRKQVYINTIRKEQAVFLIDEAQHFKKEMYPYLKDFIEHGCVFVLAGLSVPDEYATDQAPQLISEVARQMIASKNQDVLSRFIQITLNDLPMDDLEQELSDFDLDAIIFIFNAGDTLRVRVEVIDDCRAYADENGIAKITVDIARRIFNGEL